MKNNINSEASLYEEYLKPSSDYFFWHNRETNPKAGFKINIQVHPDDLRKAAQILMDKNLFYDKAQWGLTNQKIAKLDSGRLAIILYENTAANKETWKARLTEIEKSLFEAGVRPRPLNDRSEFWAIINDKKTPGSLYCYYKKDNDITWDPNWENPKHDYTQDENGWASDKSVVGSVEIEGMQEKIEEKINEVHSNLQQEQDPKKKKLLENTIKAYEFYKGIAAMGGADAQKIQHNRNAGGSSPKEGQMGLKDALNKANEVIGEYITRKKIKVKGENILESSASCIVNAGNEDLNMGINAGGLSSAFHEDLGIAFFVQQLVEQNKERSENGVLKKGEVAVVDLRNIAGAKENSKLQNKIIIHAVGPHKGESIEAMEAVYNKIFDEAKKRRIKTIALPVLSVGIFQYSKDNASTAIAKSIKNNHQHFDNIEICYIETKNRTEQNKFLKEIETKIDKAINDIAQEEINFPEFENPKSKLPSIVEETSNETSTEEEHLGGQKNLINEFKEGFETSRTPRRYQVVLGILQNYLGVDFAKLEDQQYKYKPESASKEVTGNLLEAINNPEKFQDVVFDIANKETAQSLGTASTMHRSLNVTETTYGSEELKSFNKKAAEFLDSNEDEMWQKIASFISLEAMAKDLLRIKEKFNLEDGNEDFLKIVSSYKIIYDENSSDDQLNDAFNTIKEIFIAARLLKQNDNSVGEKFTKEKAKKLASEFISGTKNLNKIKEELSSSGLAADKIERIFTKFVALGKIENLEDLKFRIKEKKIALFHKIFSDEVMALDGLHQVKMSGEEVLFRGVDLRFAGKDKQELTIDQQEEIIKRDFFGTHIGISLNENKEKQRIASHQILDKRFYGPGELDRISYAVATTTDPGVAVRYAIRKTNTFGAYLGGGWVYEIRPKQGANGVKLYENGSNYSEVDFSQINPEDIYAVYYLEPDSTVTTFGTTEIKLKTLKSVLNPNYKKRSNERNKTENTESEDLGGLFGKIEKQRDSSKIAASEENQKYKIQKDNDTIVINKGASDVHGEYGGDTFFKKIPDPFLDGEGNKIDNEDLVANPSYYLRTVDRYKPEKIKSLVKDSVERESYQKKLGLEELLTNLSNQENPETHSTTEEISLESGKEAKITHETETEKTAPAEFLRNPEISEDSIPESEKSKELIKAEIFSPLNHSDLSQDSNLSAEVVAVLKSASLKEGSKFLEFAADSVLKKAIDAKNKENVSTLEIFSKNEWGENKSKELWNRRCARKEFRSVDLSQTYRTVFVNCTFDKDCVLPTDTKLTAAKYFSKCSFPQELMDKPENKNLKAALEKAGMTLENGYYVTAAELAREKYGAKNKDGTPNPDFKPIESFKFIEEIKLVEGR